MSEQTLALIMTGYHYIDMFYCLHINYKTSGASGIRITESVGWFGYVPHDLKLWVQFLAEDTSPPTISPKPALGTMQTTIQKQ